MDLLHDTHVWFVFSFLIFAGIIVKFAFPVLGKFLDTRIDDIKKELETSERLRVEAQEMLAQYQRKHRDAVQESKKIIKAAEKSAAQFKKKAEEELAESMARREQMLTERLKRMEQNAIDEIQAYAAGLAMGAARQIISEKLDKKINATLVDGAIVNIESNIH